MKKIPKHKKSTKQTDANRLNPELIALLDKSIGKNTNPNRDTKKILAEIRMMRKKFKGPMTLEEMNKAKREGLP